MRQLIEKFLCVALLGASLTVARAYSLGGPVGAAPDNAFETPENGYNPDAFLDLLETGPRNIGEEYRLNTPVLYYTYDAAFFDYFGPTAVASMDQAFATINNTFAYTNDIETNGIGVDGYLDDLSEFPNYTKHINTTAYGLGLTDMKSTLMGMLMPQMGLEDPDRYVWTIRNVNPNGAGIVTGGHCPENAYFEIVQRNYGIVPANQIPPYSSYINDELYSFSIFAWPNCTPPGGGPPYHYRTVPAPTDPFSPSDTAVASFGLQAGYFYTGLTRDDLAGLRYLLTTNNVNFENPAGGALLLTTNLGQTLPQLTTSNLNTLLVFAQTNDPSLTAATFGVTVTATNYFFTYVTNWNVTASFYSPPGAPFGTQIPVLSSNIQSVTFQENFIDTFGNVITNGNLTNFPGIVIPPGCNNIILNYSTNTHALLETTGLTNFTGAPVGSPPFTNTSIKNITLNQPSGEYFTLPPSQCGWQLSCQTPGYSITTVTNVIATATNTTGFVGSVSVVTYFTNHTYLAQAINCATVVPGPGSYEGIQKVKFVRADFDSELGQFFQPITNDYTMTLVTNSQVVIQRFQRVVTAPDILIQAADITPNYPFFNATAENTPNFVHDPAAVYPNTAGPGTINPQMVFTFNKVGDLFLNGSLADRGATTNAFLTVGDESTQSRFGVIWATFDGTTNAPFVYGSSLSNLVVQSLIQVSPPPPFLPDGTNGVVYPVNTFTATGGAFTSPFTWSLANGTSLPAGLNLQSDGTLSGTPTQTGTFDFIIQLTDYNQRSVTWNYTITIH